MSRFIVNDRPVQFRLPDDTPLLWALRDAANLTGTKYGCGNGDCGACTVVVDGEAVKSCLLTLGEMEGRQVTTIEALSPDRSHPLQRAFLQEQAVQCGFCTPGIIMAASALLSQNAAADEDQIKAAITNICRCGVYPRLVRAIQRAGMAMRGQERLGEPATPAAATAGAAGAAPAAAATATDIATPAAIPSGTPSAQGEHP